MVNPGFRVEINYSPTPEIPLPLSLSGICPFTNLYTLRVSNSSPPEGVWNPEAGNCPTPCFSTPGQAGRTLEAGNCPLFLIYRAEAGSWKLEAGNCPLPRNGQVQLPAGSWKLEIALRSGSQRRKLEAGNWTADLRYEINHKKQSCIGARAWRFHP